ncbi:adaptor Ad4 [Bacillus phage DK3]|uniref:Lower collar protein n=1 Tax=Bacillus phage DK3 TaxID=2500810 RepID=A0A3T0IJ71_9CAUD|nr:adaptor Ad4 [Bacillus phage DK3]AZU99833.1 lower collar protein [Bacillus phage DK3]
MALYSIELRRYIDHFTQYERPQPPIKRRIEVGQPHLFDFDYPFFDESKRKEFERKWIRRFYMREVGFETIELFKFHLENWMNERMPYYNQRFKSELIKFDPLMNTVMDREKNKTIDGSRTDDITTKGNKNGTFHVDTKDNGKFHTDSQNDVTTHSEGTGNMTSDGKVDGSTDKVVEDIGSKKANNDITNDGTSFKRHLDEDTPDGRLDITTEDGKGIIRYASKIGEDTGKDHNLEHQSIDESTKKNASDNTVEKSTSHDESNSHTTTDGTSKDVGKVDGTTENSGFQDGRNNEDTTGNSNLDQKTNQKGNETEHYLGKIGVETYSEMLQKYRETFLSIETEIYDECERKLFMLVY